MKSWSWRGADDKTGIADSFSEKAKYDYGSIRIGFWKNPKKLRGKRCLKN
jgi:hypothetical protein